MDKQYEVRQQDMINKIFEDAKMLAKIHADATGDMTYLKAYEGEFPTEFINKKQVRCCKRTAEQLRAFVSEVQRTIAVIDGQS